MTKKQKALEAIRLLKERYPDAECSLTYVVPHELLIATRLAAQCTDARVNTVTPTLFGKYPSIDALAEADVADIEEIIRPCGFFKTKAKDIVAMCMMLRDDFGGVVPDNLDDLLKLPGIGRKTANLVVGDVYGKPAIVCDTHCIRLTNRLGLTTTKDPKKTEFELMPLLPPEESNNFCHRLVMFGRDVCRARNPQCAVCELEPLCVSKGK